MLVLKSWRGPFSAGDVLDTPRGYVWCIPPGRATARRASGAVRDCLWYNFKPGDQGKEFLIVNTSGSTPPDGTLFVRLYSTWPAEKSQALIAALDQAVAALAGGVVGIDQRRDSQATGYAGSASTSTFPLPLWIIMVSGHPVISGGNAFFHNHGICIEKAAELGGACELVDEEPAPHTQKHKDWEKHYCVPGQYYQPKSDMSGGGCPGPRDETPPVT